MSVYQFAKNQWYKVFETDEIIKGGSFKPDKDDEIQYLTHYFHLHGNLSGTERFRTIIYSDVAHTSILYVSDWSDLSDVPKVGDYWQGFIRADFHREHLKEDRVYYYSIEINGYIRDDYNLFIAARYDYDNSVYPKASTSINDYPIMTKYYPYREVEE